MNRLVFVLALDPPAPTETTQYGSLRPSLSPLGRFSPRTIVTSRTPEYTSRTKSERYAVLHPLTSASTTPPSGVEYDSNANPPRRTAVSRSKWEGSGSGVPRRVVDSNCPDAFSPPAPTTLARTA